MMVGVFCSHMFAFSNSSTDAEWPQWRGPDRDGHLGEGAWSGDLDLDKLKEVWRIPLDPGYAGPIESRGKVFVAETQDKSYEVIRAMDYHTGKELRKAQWKGAMSVPFFARKNGSWIRATPAFNEGYLYVAGMEDLLVCLNAETGAEVWRVDFVATYQTEKPTFGFVSSPLVAGDYLYVQAGASFVKMDKKTGEVLWRSMDDGGGMMGSAFSSPMMTELHGVNQLVVQGRSHMAGVDPDSGSVFWKKEIPAYRGMNILTPTFYKDQIFTSNYRGRSYLFGIKKLEAGMALGTVWENKATAYMSSPVIVGKFAYMHLQNRRIVCLDLETGEERWRSKERFGEYWSMIVINGHIIALDEGGELLVLRPNPDKLEILGRKTIASSTWAHLAMAGNQVFVRELDALAAYKWAP